MDNILKGAVSDDKDITVRMLFLFTQQFNTLQTKEQLLYQINVTA